MNQRGDRVTRATLVLMMANYLIIQPYTDRPGRLQMAILVSEHQTAEAAFAELERLAERLHGVNLPADTIEMLVVDAQRRPILRGH